MTENKSLFRKLIHLLRRHHDDNMTRGVYGYMWWSGIKIILAWFLLMVPVILILKYFIDINPVIQYIVGNFSDVSILIVFLASESFLGMIPPDLFIVWASKFNTPLIFFSLLGILSYTGGIISFKIGKWLSTRPRIKAYTERALDKYIITARKWGGAFIIISALFPFSPFSMVVIAVSLLKYPFRLYLLFGISRIVRFIVQGIIYLNILNVDTFFGL